MRRRGVLTCRRPDFNSPNSGHTVNPRAKLMPSDGDSFLPRIESVFYAVFDVKQGPKIVYQVPEGLIAPPPSLSNASVPPTPSSIDPLPATPFPGVESRNSSTSHMSPTDSRPGSYGLQSPQKRSTSLNRILFNFDDISKYVIPQPALCGRLVICSAQRYRIIGFPVNLQGEYERNYFTYNLCFVFARSADLSCYEPIVRKVSRVLTSCEVRKILAWMLNQYLLLSCLC